MSRTLFLLTAAAVVASALPAALLAAQADPDRAAAGGGALPPGWRAQADWASRTGRFPSLEDVKFIAMGNGFHATMGPRAIFWRDADSVSGSYHVVASLTQTKNPEHPEAYGIFIGGKDLAGERQTYTYFVLRKDAKFSIRRRAGQKVEPTAVVDWTAHEAVNKPDSAGRATNELSVLVQGGQVTFMVNGKEVHKTDASKVDIAGIVGYRVNHDLDVHLGPLGIHPMRASQ